MNFILRLADKEVDYVFGVLAQRPWAEVAPLLGNIKMQIDEQQQQARPAPAITSDGTVVRMPNGAATQ